MKTSAKFQNVLFCTVLVLSQSPTKARPSFEVSVVKPNSSGDNRQEISASPGGRFSATGATLKFLMTMAYGVPNHLISGGPDWLLTDRWDIQAKSEDGYSPRPTAPNQADPMALRLQSLIEDKFKLKAHLETRELPTYDLVVATRGPKIILSADQTPVGPPDPGAPQLPGDMPPRGKLQTRGGLHDATIQATAVPLENLAKTLSGAVGRTVVDKTNLKGLYDFRLVWPREQGTSLSPDTVPSDIGPSIFTAIQEQLGLRLVSAKGPVEVLVIDSVQKPTVN